MNLTPFSEFTPFESYTILLSFGIVILTTVYAYFTYLLFSESRKMREIQINPKLSIYLSCETRELIFKNLVIANIGLGPAYNIKFEVIPDFTLFNEKQLSDIPLIKAGIPYMAPNFKYEFLISDVNWEKYADKSFVIKATYQNSLKKLTTDEFIIDFSVWEGLTMINPKGFSDVVNKLEKIETSIRELKER